MPVHLETADPKHIPRLASTLRQSDKNEVKMMSNLRPQKGLRLSLENSQTAFTIMDDRGVPLGMYGGRVYQPGQSIVWFVAAEGLKKYSKQVLRDGEFYTDMLQLRLGTPLLYNYTLPENTLHHRWCEAAGFTVDYDKEHNVGHNGAPFYCLHRYKEL